MKENIKPKEYVIQTLRQGNKERITKVLRRYWKLQAELKAKDQYETAVEIFSKK